MTSCRHQVAAICNPTNQQNHQTTICRSTKSISDHRWPTRHISVSQSRADDPGQSDQVVAEPVSNIIVIQPPTIEARSASITTQHDTDINSNNRVKTRVQSRQSIDWTATCTHKGRAPGRPPPTSRSHDQPSGSRHGVKPTKSRSQVVGGRRVSTASATTESSEPCRDRVSDGQSHRSKMINGRCRTKIAAVMSR